MLLKIKIEQKSRPAIRDKRKTQRSNKRPDDVRSKTVVDALGPAGEVRKRETIRVHLATHAGHRLQNANDNEAVREVLRRVQETKRAASSARSPRSPTAAATAEVDDKIRFKEVIERAVSSL